MRRRNRGEIRIVEAFLSAIIIFAALAISSGLSPPTNNKNEKTLGAQGLAALIELDNDGSLGKMLEQKEWVDLSDALRFVLPVGVSYNLTVYDANMLQINNQPISNGPLVGDVVSVEYVCASQSMLFKSYVLRLQLTVVR